MWSNRDESEDAMVETKKRNMQFDYSTGSRQQSKCSIVNNLMGKPLIGFHVSNFALTATGFMSSKKIPHENSTKNGCWNQRRTSHMRTSTAVSAGKNWIFHEFRAATEEKKSWPDIRSSSSPRGECLTRLFLELHWSEQQQPECMQCTTDFERWEWNIC